MYTTLIAAVPGDVHVTTALESIYGQTVEPTRVEVITDVAAHVPADWRAAILDRFPDVHFRVQSGTGMTRALNVGIENVETPFVSFLDCDDLWRPEKQGRQMARLIQDESLDAVGCRVITVTMGESADYHASSAGGSAAGSNCYLFTGTTFRTEVFRNFGHLDASAGHFTWLYRWWSQARSSGIRTTCIDYIGLERRIHAGNSWVVNNERAHRDLLTELRTLAAKRVDSE